MHFCSLISVPENVVPVRTEKEFNTAFSKIEGESVPAVLYFTAKWCASCRYIGPILVELDRRTRISMRLDPKAED
ncbi:hypothetical protein V6N11_067625 [Hibiscus sabdariffa]|uniref:Thioredoxin domain-containing protein n=1 Tax=Hibiscus sabdariffa TaxID=183260 RepID=A0ABR2SSA5_9ROSI